MIKLSNGHEFQFMVASGALGYDGWGWPWERPLCRIGLIRPELFTVVTKTITLKAINPNGFCWWKPWQHVRLISGGAVNKFGLVNPGIEWWCRNIGPQANLKRLPLVVSIAGETDELWQLAQALDIFDLAGIEVNVSCPNRPLPNLKKAIEMVLTVKRYSRFPLLVKVSAIQDCCNIAYRLRDVAEAVSLNGVPWETVFPKTRSPLWRLQERIGGNGGGVSGKPAQKHNWKAVDQLAMLKIPPVIAPDIMEYGDLDKVDELGASAYSFGAIHLRAPCKPTRIVRRRLAWQSRNNPDLVYK